MGCILALHLETQECKSFEPAHDGAPNVPCNEAIAINATKSKDGMIAIRRERVKEQREREGKRKGGQEPKDGPESRRAGQEDFEKKEQCHERFYSWMPI
jgi:hypothetical protein